MNLKDILKKRPDKRDYYYQRQAYVEELDTFIDELEQAINFTGCCESDSEQLKIDKYNEPLTGEKGTYIGSIIGDCLDDF
tara:strand:- start:213 stop:452 length:240 start_codon:yes stop_codon:yes gene_type:complete